MIFSSKLLLVTPKMKRITVKSDPREIVPSTLDNMERVFSCERPQRNITPKGPFLGFVLRLQSLHFYWKLTNWEQSTGIRKCSVTVTITFQVLFSLWCSRKRGWGGRDLFSSRVKSLVFRTVSTRRVVPPQREAWAPPTTGLAQVSIC